MKWRRMIMFGSILFATVYVSVYGGTISYLMFFITLLIPALAMGYMCYVYSRFKVFQRVETRALVKGQEVPYYFSLSNESFMAFTSVAVSFLGEKQVVRDLKERQEYCLLPGESVRKTTTLLARYRGEYEVGIDSVTIKDFFELFRLTYTCRSKIQAKVLPRIVKLESLCFLSEEEDEKQDKMRVSFSKQVPGGDIRIYLPGDDRKKIHWKLSASRDMLMVKQYTRLPQVERVLLLDLSSAEGEELHRLRLEDKVIECALAIVNYMFIHDIGVTILYGTDRLGQLKVQSQMDFEEFYHFCSEVAFHQEENMEQLLRVCEETIAGEASYILVSCHVTKQLCARCYEMMESGNEVNIIRIWESGEGLFTPESIPIYSIEPDDHLEEKLAHKGW